MNARKQLALLAAAALTVTGAAVAAETIAYRYDARGRLIKVERSGNVNNGVNTSYAHDKANNRTNKTVVDGSAPPVANNDAVEIPRCSDAEVPVLANDLGVAPLTITAVTPGTLGTATHNGTIITYSAGQVTGQDVITYTVQDGNGGTDTATLTVTVIFDICPL